MDLPTDDHTGWDRLLAAVLDDGADDDAPRPDDRTAPADRSETATDDLGLVRLLDLGSMHLLTGDNAQGSPTR